MITTTASACQLRNIALAHEMGPVTLLNMDWQEVSALAIVGATAGAFAWARIRRRRRRFSFERDTHCGCAKSGGQSAPTVIYRARKDGSSQVVVRMK